MPYSICAEIEFDPAKNAANIQKHGIDLAFAVDVLADPFVVSIVDARRNYGETRWISLGEVLGRVYVVIHTRRKHVSRIISVRKANDRETSAYRAAVHKD